MPFFFPLYNQIYEKHNHNTRALLFYYQWVLLLEKTFQMICHMGTNIIYKPLMTCKHYSSLRCKMTPSHSVCSARLSTGKCSGTLHALRIKKNKQEEPFLSAQAIQWQ